MTESGLAVASAALALAALALGFSLIAIAAGLVWDRFRGRRSLEPVTRSEPPYRGVHRERRFYLHDRELIGLCLQMSEAIYQPGLDDARVYSVRELELTRVIVLRLLAHVTDSDSDGLTLTQWHALLDETERAWVTWLVLRLGDEASLRAQVAASVPYPAVCPVDLRRYRERFGPHLRFLTTNQHEMRGVTDGHH